MNSVYITSAPFSLQSARKGGSDTSSIGAKSNGKSPTSIFPIFTAINFLQKYTLMGLKGVFSKKPLLQKFVVYVVQMILNILILIINV